MSVMVILVAFAWQSAAASPCPNGKAACEPWERKWGPTLPLPGDVVTSNGRIIPPTSLAGLRLGQSLPDAQKIYSSHGRRMVKVNRAFEEAYEIYNLVNDQQKMVGNASFCRDKLVSVIVTLNTATDYFQAMKRFVQSHGQPVIGFKMIPADDETRTYEDMVASWPRSALDVSHPVALEGRKGAIILSTNEACR